MNSGYIVAGPPSRASGGVPKKSVRFGFSPGSALFPGRKCATLPRGIAVSVASSQGYGGNSIAGSRRHIIVLRTYGSAW